MKRGTIIAACLLIAMNMSIAQNAIEINQIPTSIEEFLELIDKVA